MKYDTYVRAKVEVETTVVVDFDPATATDEEYNAKLTAALEAQLVQKVGPVQGISVIEILSSIAGV